jgi:hypothetical protein
MLVAGPTPLGTGHVPHRPAKVRSEQIKSIVLKFDRLLSDHLDTMPRGSPICGSMVIKHGQAMGLDAGGPEDSAIDQRRSPAAESGDNNQDRPQLLFDQEVSNLVRRIECVGLDLLYRKDLGVLHSSETGHQLGYASGYRIGKVRLSTQSLDRNQHPRSQASSLQDRRLLEQSIVWIEVLHYDEVD